MAADSAVHAGYMLRDLAETKIIKRDSLIFGVSGDLRIRALLACELSIPKPTEGVSDYDYISHDLVAELRACFKAGGVQMTKDGQESFAGSLLAGWRGHLYHIGSSYATYSVKDPYTAIGSGAEIASGALYVLKNADLAPEVKLRRALEAAAKYNPYVRSPFVVLKQGR